MEKEIEVKRLLLFVNSYSINMETFIYNQIAFLNKVSLYKLTILCHYLPEPNFNIHPDIEVIQKDDALLERNPLFDALVVTFELNVQIVLGPGFFFVPTPSMCVRNAERAQHGEDACQQNPLHRFPLFKCKGSL